MEMKGSRQLAVTKQQAWDALNDPEVLKACIPGCDKVEATGENQYAVGMAVKIGPVSAKFSGKITLSEINPPDSYTITFEGTGGPAGFGKGNAKVTLEPTQVGCCELAYTVQAQVGGKVAQLGQRLIDGAARSLSEDFFERFEEEMQRRHPLDESMMPPVIRVSELENENPVVEEVPQSLGIFTYFPLWAWILSAIVILLIIMVVTTK